MIKVEIRRELAICSLLGRAEVTREQGRRRSILMEYKGTQLPGPKRLRLSTVERYLKRLDIQTSYSEYLQGSQEPDGSDVEKIDR